MKPKANKPVGKKKQLIIFGSIFGIILLLFGWWAFVNLRTYPLGDKLEYLGKQDLGGGLFFSDSRPYSEYYYGTDMTAEEVVGYFRGAEVEPIRSNLGFVEIRLKNKITTETARLSFYERPELSQIKFEKRLNKKHVIDFDAKYYEVLKASL